jgi:MoxR-like ATPase
MAIEMPQSVQDALVRTGLVSAAATQTRTVHVDRGTPVASYATGTPAPVPGFIPPPWYPRLRFTLRSSTQRGACLFGPRGSGKTHSVHTMAKSEGVQLITFQAAAGCTLDDLVGVRDLVDGRTTFTPGPLPEALVADCWLLIEEANAMHPGVFSKFNTLTDGSGDTLRLPDGTRLAVGPNFRLILAFNEGAAYSGTKEVNAALRDRLMPIYADYLPEASEISILTSRTGCDEVSARRLIGFAKLVRDKRAEIGVDLSPRAMMRVLELIRDLGESWSEAFEHGILDLIGDPLDKRATRAAVSGHAAKVGLSGWSRPKFSMRPAPVASNATVTRNGTPVAGAA